MKVNNFCTVLAVAISLNGASAMFATAYQPLAQSALTLDVGGGASVLVRQADGKVIAAGSFTKINGDVCANLARFNSDGTKDVAFNPVVNGTVSVAVVPDSSDTYAMAARLDPVFTALARKLVPAFTGKPRPASPWLHLTMPA